MDSSGDEEDEVQLVNSAVDPPEGFLAEPHAVQGARELPDLVVSSPGAAEAPFANTLAANSSGDFQEQQGKRRKSNTPSPPLEDLNEHNCPICLEPWSINGEHRCASLKCGHLFGRSCILRWIDRKGRTKDSKAKCPECNQTALRKDVRVIWARKIVAVDSEEMDKAINEAKAAKAALHEAQQTAARFQLAYNMAQAEAGKMSQECERLRRLNAEYVHEAKTW